MEKIGEKMERRGSLGVTMGLVIGLGLTATGYVTAETVLAPVMQTGAVFQKIEKQGLRTLRKEVLIAEAKPGDELSQVLTYSNTGDQPVKDVVMTAPVPKDLEYISTSILKKGETDASFEVSVDGGLQYGSLSNLLVSSPTGEEPQRAKAKDVTHVRWLLKSSMAPEEDLYIFLRGRVRGPIDKLF